MVLGFSVIHAEAQSNSNSAVLSPVNSAYNQTLHAEVSVFNESFISPDFNTAAGSNFQFVGAKYNNIPQAGADTESRNLNVEFSGVFSPEQTTMSYFNVSQIYLDGGWGVQIGRKKNDWSLLDEQWHLGFFQPDLRWNPLLPESQGLTGFFLTLKNDNVKSPMGVRFFGSFLFLPDQGAGYQVTKGSFQSVNPWFPQMPSQIQFDSAGTVVNQINWNVQTPEISKVIFNPSYMSQVFYGQEHRDLYAAATLGYKPSNQFLMAVNSATLPTATTMVNIYPEVYYHTVGAVDLRYSASSYYVGVSMISEKPSTPEQLPADVNYRVYNSRQIYSPTLGMQGRGFEASLSYLDIEGVSDFTTGPQSTVIGNYLPQQIGFGNAWQGQVSYTFGRSFLPGLKLSSTYIQGASDDFALWNSTALYKLTRQWSLSGSVMLVRAEATSTTASLFQQFQNNDLATVGANYAF